MSPLLSLLLTLSFAAPSSVGTPDAGRKTFDFFVAAGLEGMLARPECAGEAVLPEANRFYAKLVTAYQKLARTSREPPIAVNLGDAVFPAAYSRYLLSQGQSGSETLVDLLARIPYSLMILGNYEFSNLPAQTEAYAKAVLAKLPVSVANLECLPGATSPWCEAAATTGRAPWVVVERAGLRIGLVAALDPKLGESVGVKGLAKVRLSNPAEVLSNAATLLREAEGVDLMVALYHSVGTGGNERLVEMAPKLVGVDLLISNLPMEVEPKDKASPPRPGWFVAPESGTFVVGAHTGATSFFSLEAEVARVEGGRWAIRHLEALRHPLADVAPDPETGELLARAAAKVCAEWGVPLRSDLRLSKAFELSDFARMTLNAMRATANAEVAISNAGAFRSGDQFPLKETLTRANVYASLPYDNALVTMKLSGVALEAVAQRLGQEVLAAGLEKEGDSILVNGRPLDRGRLYSVAMNQYVADGGDGLVPDRPKARTVYQADWAGGEVPSINEIVIHFVESGRFMANGETTLSPNAGFPNLHALPLWRFIGSFTASYNRSSVTNPNRGEYKSSDLAKPSTTLADLEARGLASMDMANHAWDNELLVQYGKQKLGAAASEQYKDLIRLRSAYRLLWVREQLGKKPYIPAPLAEVQLETEFQRSEAEQWHKMLLTGILGVSFRLVEPLELKAGFNVLRDVNAPSTDPLGRTTVGLNLGYTLRRFDVATVYGRPIQFESGLDFFFNDIGNENIVVLRNANRLSFALLDQLFVTAGAGAFLYRSSSVGQLGSSLQFLIGINYLFDTYVQTL